MPMTEWSCRVTQLAVERSRNSDPLHGERLRWEVEDGTLHVYDGWRPIITYARGSWVAVMVVESRGS